MTGTADLRRVVNWVERVSMTSRGGVGELEQIVGGADHGPLGSDLVEAAQEELAEASGMFDMAEHRFNDLLSQAVTAAPAGELEFSGHGGLARSFGPAPRTGSMFLAVACPARSQIGGDPAAGEMGQVVLVAVSGVGGDFLGIGPQHRTDVGEQRRQRAGIR